MGHSTFAVESLGALAMLSVLAAISVAFRPRRLFRQRGLGALLLAQLALQGLLHLAMSGAPWAFGLPPHPGVVVIDEGALLPHLIAALVLALVCLGVDRMLATALDAIAFLRQLVQTIPQGGRAPRWDRVSANSIATTDLRSANPGAARAPPSVLQ